MVARSSLISRYDRPGLFYGLATLIPWAIWFLAARLSHITPTSRALAVVLVIRDRDFILRRALPGEGGAPA
jgi:hypothetical protein